MAEYDLVYQNYDHNKCQSEYKTGHHREVMVTWHFSQLLPQRDLYASLAHYHGVNEFLQNVGFTFLHLRSFHVVVCSK